MRELSSVNRNVVPSTALLADDRRVCAGHGDYIGRCGKK